MGPPPPPPSPGRACNSFHTTKSRLVIAIWQGPGLVATKMPFFRYSNLLQFLSSPVHGRNLPFLSARSAHKMLHHLPFKSSQLCPTGFPPVPVFKCLCAYQLICIWNNWKPCQGDNWHLHDGCKGAVVGLAALKLTLHFCPCAHPVSVNCRPGAGCSKPG